MSDELVEAENLSSDSEWEEIEDEEEEEKEKNSKKLVTEVYKVVFVVRNDLKMGKGKIAAQCAHAAVGIYSKALKSSPVVLRAWEWTGQCKVALKVDSEEELKDIFRNAKNAGLTVSLVSDAGRTQVDPGTKTVLGIGPAPLRVLDDLTGHLKLL